MAMTLDPTLNIPGPRNQLSEEDKRKIAEAQRKAEIERLTAEQITKQKAGEIGRRTFSPIPGQATDPNVVPESFNINQDMQGNYWNRQQRSEGGPVVIERLASEYAPKDQKKIEQLYQWRSEAATDPGSEPEEMQAALDRIDTMISKVPKMPPIMREPTPQQKFDASIVTDQATGLRGIFDPKTGKFNPLEDQKAVQAQQEKRQDALNKELTAEIKNNEALMKEGGTGADYDVLLKRAKWRVKAQFGELEESGKVANPELDVLWENTMNQLDYGGPWRKKGTGRAEKEDMLAARRKYIENATEKNDVSAVQAGYDFMLRWNEAGRNIDDQYNFLVPAFNKDQRRDMMYASTGVKTEGDPIYGGSNPADFAPAQRAETIGGLRVGEGKVTVDGKTVSTFDDTVAVISPSGKKGRIPSEDLQEALAEGYKVIE